MPSRQFHKTKVSVKLPPNVQKGKVVSAYSTANDVTIEGYKGKIEVIKQSEITIDMLPCRSKDRRVWVKLEK